MTLDEAFAKYGDETKIRRSFYINKIEDLGSYTIKWLKELKELKERSKIVSASLLPKIMVEDLSADDWEVVG